jgi:hypothetical protein
VNETEDQRAFEIARDSSVPVGPGADSSFDETRLDFGHHSGRTIVELAAVDPEYLRWLARHPSGVRYRAEIARVMGSAVPRASDWER